MARLHSFEHFGERADQRRMRQIYISLSLCSERGRLEMRRRPESVYQNPQPGRAGIKRPRNRLWAQPVSCLNLNWQCGGRKMLNQPEMTRITTPRTQPNVEARLTREGT